MPEGVRIASLVHIRAVLLATLENFRERKCRVPNWKIDLRISQSDSYQQLESELSCMLCAYFLYGGITDCLSKLQGLCVAVKTLLTLPVLRQG